MNKGSDNVLEAIRSSQGMEHINRSHHRTFSLNIFRLNAQELIEITRRINDPDEVLRLLSPGNREASEQTHREVTRRVHNFVAASLTLVDHTRKFIRKHYGDTPILHAYKEKVAADFANDPLVRFVQDLRNFMLHNGLPVSEIFLHFEANPDLPDGAGDFTTGIHIRADQLSTWDGWTAPARAFLKNCGEFVDIRAFTETYTDKIIAFQVWLQAELDQFHLADLQELRALQAALNDSTLPTDPPLPSAEAVTQASQRKDEELEHPFSFASHRTTTLDRAAEQLLGKVREIELPGQRMDEFASERPIRASITPQDMIGTPHVWGNDVAGRRVFVFIHRNGQLFGLDEQSFVEVQTFTEGVLASDWARRTLSRSFIEKVVIQWLQSRFAQAGPNSLSEAIAQASRKAVRPLELWAPIANLEVQTRFKIGPVDIAPMTRAMIDELETQANTAAPEQRENTARVFDNLRRRMQGLAAIVFKADGEIGKIKEDGAAIAQIGVGLLRFFSPAAAHFPMVCGNALLGMEIVPTSNLLVLGAGTFFQSQGVLVPNPPYWRISEEALRQIRPALDAVGALVLPEGLSAFAQAVRSSLLLFGTGATFSNPMERLTYTLSSLEALLLRHSAEPVEFSLSERLGLLLAQDTARREETARNVREAYRLRARQDISPLAPREMSSVATFLRQSYNAIGIALANVDRFKTVAEFVAAVDIRKTQANVPEN